MYNSLMLQTILDVKCGNCIRVALVLRRRSAFFCCNMSMLRVLEITTRLINALDYLQLAKKPKLKLACASDPGNVTDIRGQFVTGTCTYQHATDTHNSLLSSDSL